MNLKHLTVAILFFAHIGYCQEMKVTLLGTGTPLPGIERFGPSTLVEANGQYLLFDCGRGASQRLWQKKIPLGKINQLFISHLHSDHVVGIPDLWLTSVFPTNFGRRTSPLEIWGPPGAEDMAQGLMQAFQWDIATRKRETNQADSTLQLKAHTINEGIIYDKAGVRVTAFLVDHSEFVDYAYGFRIEYKGHSVILSGDTRYSENLIKNSMGADVLVHEVAIANPELIQKSAIARKIQGFHTTPEEAGKIFAITKPAIAVYSHIALILTDPVIPPADVNDLIPRTRKYYDGRLEIGEDLMTIEVGETISVRKNK